MLWSYPWRGVNGLRELQLYSEKCTGRYFKERDDDLSSKKGSIQNETYSKIFLSIYLHIRHTLGKAYKKKKKNSS